MSTPDIKRQAEMFRDKIIDLADWIRPFISNRKMLYCTGLLWVSFQIVYVILFSYTDLVSDPGYYVYYAQECVKHGTMFPDHSNLHGEYIYSPGWINMIILWIRIFGSVESLPYLAIVLNIIIVLMLHKLSMIITRNRNMANLAAYIFMLLPSNSSIVIHAFTEVPFEFLSLLSSLLIFSRKYYAIVIAAVAIALAQWIRPLGIAWIISALFYMIYKDRRYAHALVYSLSIMATLSIIGYASMRNFPRPIFQAQTGGVNFIMSANDFATGGYCGKALTDPNGLGYLPGLRDTTRYIPVLYNDRNLGYVHPYSTKYTYYEADSIFMARGIDWICKNPIKWASLIPRKVNNLYWIVPRFFYTYSDKADTPLLKVLQAYGRIASFGWHVIFIFALLGIFTPFWKRKEYTCCVITIAICSAMTMATCCEPRYNFIMMPLEIIFSCYSMNYYHKLLRKRIRTE